MSDHGELSDQRDGEADAMEREGERVREGADAARDALKKAYADAAIPEPMGEDDPGRLGNAPDKPEEHAGGDQPETDYPAKR